jgi:APA family basic amino acid/polyamine antiporter
MNEPGKDEGLKRVIGVGTMATNAVNLTVGAGIFALPAVVAGQLGAGAIWAYLLCGLLLGLVLLCFAEVGSKMSITGGVYTYVEEAFGPLAGFLINTLYWLGFSIMADAAVANVLVDNLAVLFPVFTNPSVRILFLALVFGGIAALNVIGVRESSRFIVGITIAKLLPLILLIFVGCFYITSANLALGDAPTIKNLGEGALILFFAFGGGAESTLTATGEIRNPKRTIPRGLLLGALVVFLIYLSIQVVAQGVLGDALAAQKEAPLVAVAQIVLGNYGSVLLIAAAAVSCFGLISGDILVTSRLPYAAARDGLLPAILGKIHPRFATPANAIMFFSFVGFILSVSGSFRQLAILSSSAILIIYIGVIASTIRMRSTKVENGFLIPGGLTVPILALLATGWFLSNLAWMEIVAVVIFLAFFTAVYYLRKVWVKRIK